MRGFVTLTIQLYYCSGSLLCFGGSDRSDVYA